MNALDQSEKVITATSWTRDRIIAEQIVLNYRLVREEQVTARKVALVFKKIEFQPVIEIGQMRVRFKEVADQINELGKEK